MAWGWSCPSRSAGSGSTWSRTRRHGFEGDTARKRHGIWTNKVRNKRIATIAQKHYDEGDQVLVLVDKIEHLLHLAQLLPDFALCYGNIDEADENVLPEVQTAACQLQAADGRSPQAASRGLRVRQDRGRHRYRRLAAGRVVRRAVSSGLGRWRFLAHRCYPGAVPRVADPRRVWQGVRYRLRLHRRVRRTSSTSRPWRGAASTRSTTGRRSNRQVRSLRASHGCSSAEARQWQEENSRGRHR